MSQTMQHIPLVDLKAQYDAHKDAIDAAIAGVIEQTSFIGGDILRGFEQHFAAYQETRHAVAVASGTGGIMLTLLALGIQPGDEIITTPHTFIATIEPIESLGAVPVFVDIDPQTYNLDPAQIESAITPRTRALMPVHLYGQIAAMDRICAIAKAHNLFVIEDAAQAHGARFQGRRAGHWGDATIFSFYPGKNLGAYGDAGAVCTNRDDIAARVAKLRNHGRSEKYAHDVIGYGERCDTLQAAILDAKLPHLDAWSEARRRHAARYTEALADVPGLETPYIPADSEPVFHIYCVRVQGDQADRDNILSELKARGVGTGIHYPIPLHLQPALAHRGYQKGDFPVTERAAQTIISLPIYPEMRDDQRDYVIAQLRDIVGC